MLDKMALDTQKKSLTSQVEKLKTSLKQIAEGLNGCDDLMTRKLRALLVGLPSFIVCAVGVNIFFFSQCVHG
jgi:hypothetical protein